MSISTGTSTNRVSGQLHVARLGSLLGTGGMGHSGSASGGGLLEAFDQIFRSSIQASPKPESTPAEQSRPSDSKVESTSDRASQDAIGNASESTTVRDETSESQHTQTDSLALPQAETVGETEASWLDRSFNQEDATDAVEEQIGGVGELVESAESETEESETELGPIDLAIAAMGTNANQNADTKAVEAETPPIEADAEQENLRLVKTSNAELPESGAWSDANAEQEVDLTAASDEVEAKAMDSSVTVTLSEDQEQSPSRAKRSGARYSDKKSTPAQASGERLSDSMAVGQEGSLPGSGSMPGDILQEIAGLEPVAAGEALVDPSQLATEIASPLVAQSQQVVVPMDALAAAVQALASGGSSAEPTSEAAASDKPLSATEATLRRDSGVREGVAEGKEVRAGSNDAQVRLVQRVARAFQRLGPDGGRVNIMLHPAELGSLKLELNIDGQSMQARMIAESETAANVLRENLPELRRRLVEAGMVVQNIELQVADQQTADSGGNRFMSGHQEDRSQQGPHQHRGADGRGNVKRANDGLEAAHRDTQTAVRRSSSRAALDLRL